MKQEDKEWLENALQKKMQRMRWEFAEGYFQTEITVHYFPMDFCCILQSAGGKMTAQVTQVHFMYVGMSPVIIAAEAETYTGGQALEKVKKGLTEQISVLVDEIEELGIAAAISEYQKQIAYFRGKKDATIVSA